MPLDARDEQTHKPNDHRYWNESFYFNFFDEQEGLGGSLRVGFSPNRNSRDGFFCFYFPDGQAGLLRSYSPHSSGEHGVPEQAIEAGPLRFTRLKNYQSWRAIYDGPVFTFSEPERMGDFMQVAFVDLPKRDVKLDLSFESLHEPFDFHATIQKRLLSPSKVLPKLAPDHLFKNFSLAVRNARSLPAMSGAHHYEQAVIVSGTVTIDGKVHNVNGMGQRDHSWGVRDMRVPTNWRWFSCQFGQELCFNATRVEVLGMEAVGGYAFIDGKPHGLKDWEIRSTMHPGGDWADRVELKLTLDNGKVIPVSGDLLTNIPVLIETEGQATVVNEGLARFEWNGRKALGISEFMGQRFP